MGVQSLSGSAVAELNGRCCQVEDRTQSEREREGEGERERERRVEGRWGEREVSSA